MLIRVILGLEAMEGRLFVEPHMPAVAGWVELLDIPGAWGRADAYARGLLDVDIEPLEVSVRGDTTASSTRVRGPQQPVGTR
jgi:hypothetical protein